MKILNYLKEENVIFGDLLPGSKESVFAQILTGLKFGDDKFQKRVISSLLERESLGSTAVGRGICIPHARIEGISEMYLGIYLLKKGIDFESLDKKTVRAFFVFFCPHDEVKLHLRFLARLSRLLRDDKLRERILNSQNSKDVIEAIYDYEENHMG